MGNRGYRPAGVHLLGTWDFDLALTAERGMGMVMGMSAIENQGIIYFPNPMKLISWWDMNQFRAEGFFLLGQELKILQEVAMTLEEKFPGGKIDEQIGEDITPRLENAIDLASQVGLTFTLMWITEAMEAVKENCSTVNLRTRIWSITQSVRMEMEAQLFLYVPTTRSGYYHGGKESVLSPECAAIFSTLDRDAREAGNAFACALYTACVFHLMRVMEGGLRAVALSLKIPVDGNQNWSHILEKFQKERIEKNPEINAVWMAHEVFYRSARSTLCAVKDAWRNETMHIERHYDETEASEIIGAVRAFMRHLATHIDQRGQFV